MCNQSEGVKIKEYLYYTALRSLLSFICVWQYESSYKKKLLNLYIFEIDTSMHCILCCVLYLQRQLVAGVQPPGVSS